MDPHQNIHALNFKMERTAPEYGTVSNIHAWNLKMERRFPKYGQYMHITWNHVIDHKGGQGTQRTLCYNSQYLSCPPQTY